MTAGQRKAAQAVIELRTAPIRIGVAVLTRRRETCGAMIRIGGAIEIRRMAAKTVRSRSLKNSAHMTGSALDRGVSPHQPEARGGVVVELR